MRLRVAGQLFAVYINNEPVVEYVEPTQPYRIAPNEQTRLSEGILAFVNTGNQALVFGFFIPIRHYASPFVLRANITKSEIQMLFLMTDNR